MERLPCMTAMQFCVQSCKSSEAVLRIKSYQNGQKVGPMTLCCSVYLSSLPSALENTDQLNAVLC